MFTATATHLPMSASLLGVLGTRAADASRRGAAAASTSILVLHNVAKKKNFGDLIRTAAAMGVDEVVVVGAAKLATHGAHGCASHMRFSHFASLPTACAYLRDVRGASLCGVEITPEARPVQAHPFSGATAFLMGNEGQGLTPAQLAACDQFVYIPQHSEATASLNVNAACAVVLHHFAMWAALPEAPRDGFKYVLGPPPSSVAHSGMGLKQMRTLDADGNVVSHRRHLTDDAAEEEEAAWDLADDDEAGEES